MSVTTPKSLVHPLLIPEVLENVFSYCSFDDLKSCRSVCQQWYGDSLEKFRSRAGLHFPNYHKMQDFMNVIKQKEEEFSSGEAADESAKKDILFYKNLSSKVRLSGLEFQKLPLLLQPFLLDFGKYLKVLEIDHGSATHCPSGIGEFLQEFKKANLQLDTLILSGSYLTYDPRDRSQQLIMPSIKTLKVLLSQPKAAETGTQFFRELLRSFPNLESLTCINYQLLSLLVGLNPVFLPQLRLTDLHLHLWNADGIPQFIRRGYSLKTLKLNVAVTMSRDNLHALIQSQCSTLKHLEIYFPTENFKGDYIYSYSHNATSFPSARRMKRLKYLRLIGFWGDLYFLKDIPSLQRMDAECMLPEIAFPKGTKDEKLLPKRVRKILRFWDHNGVFHEV